MERGLSFPAILLIVFFSMGVAVAVVLYVFFPGVHDSVNNFVGVPGSNNGDFGNSLTSNPGCSPASNPTLAGLCSDKGYTCGNVSNGTCGDVSCGTCVDGYVCNLTTNKCVISSSSCSPASNPTLSGICGSQECGTAQNGTCGDVTCGTCDSGYTCSSGTCTQQQTIPPPPPLPS